MIIQRFASIHLLHEINVCNSNQLELDLKKIQVTLKALRITYGFLSFLFCSTRLTCLPRDSLL